MNNIYKESKSIEVIIVLSAILMLVWKPEHFTFLSFLLDIIMGFPAIFLMFKGLNVIKDEMSSM